MPALVRAGIVLIFAATHGVSAPHQRQQPQAKEPFAGVLDEHPAIQYATRPTRDRVALLKQSLA
jgi:hypothetical protein